MPVGDYDVVTVLRLTIVRATGQFTFCRQFMRKSVSAARGARYNFERSLRLWKTALPRGGDLGRTVPWNGSPAARIWRIAVRAFNDASQNRFLSRGDAIARARTHRAIAGE
jgi:hypothetical protein